MSPNFPDNYGVNIDCTWTINGTGEGRPPRITVSSLEIQEEKDCSKDRLEIRDGDTATSPAFPHSPYCGTLENLRMKMYGNDKKIVFFYPNKSAWIRFVSDENEYQKRGFLVTFESGKYLDPVEDLGLYTTLIYANI